MRLRARAGATEGARQALALAPGLVPLGILFGAAAAGAGFSAWAALALSAGVFAGGAQLAVVGLVAAGAGALEVAAVVLTINARYLLLAVATLDLARPGAPGRPARLVLCLGVVDEAYALQAAWARRAAVPVAGLLGVAGALWVLWVAATGVGVALGEGIPDLRPYGLDYVLPGLFVGLLGIFADTRARAAAGLSALAVAGALALLGAGLVAVLLVPPAFALAWGRWAGRGR